MSRMIRLSVFALSLLAAGAVRAQPSYQVVKRIRIGGEGGWDYLLADPGRHRLFLSRGTHVMVLDTERDTVIADIGDTPGVHGIALAPELNRGFISNGRDSTVTIFDYTTLAPIGRVKVTGRNPDAILYDPTSKRVFTFNGGSADATALDAATGSVLGTMALGGKPEAANDDGHGRIFVNIEDKGEVVAFDAKTLAVLNRWPVAGCDDPTGQGIDRKSTRLFLSCGNKVVAVVNYTNGKVETTVPIGAGSDGNYFDAASGLDFATNGGDGTVTVIRHDMKDGFVVAATVPTQRGARTIAMDERTHRVYTVSAEFGPVPEPTADRPRPRPPLIPGSFTVIVLAPSK